MLFAGLGSVRMLKNYDLGLENASLGLRPRAAFSRLRSQFFTIRTSQPANNVYLLGCCALVCSSSSSPVLEGFKALFVIFPAITLHTYTVF